MTNKDDDQKRAKGERQQSIYLYNYCTIYLSIYLSIYIYIYLYISIYIYIYIYFYTTTYILNTLMTLYGGVFPSSSLLTSLGAPPLLFSSSSLLVYHFDTLPPLLPLFLSLTKKMRSSF